jgi:hypothetical protein
VSKERRSGERDSRFLVGRAVGVEAFKRIVRAWTHGPDWKTWVAHSALALVIAGAASLLFGFGSGWKVAIGYYLIRELEQILYGFVDHEPFRPKALDHLLDVVCPAATVLAIVGLLSLV